MATATVNKIYDNSSDANFVSWAQAISTQLAAMGWVQTADTGQINWGTVTRPTATNTAQGYEVWRLDDTLQATKPFFAKIEYGSGSSANHPAVWITVGTGTNGAGTLTGTVTARQQLAAGGNIAAAQVCKFSGANNRFVCALAPEYNNAANMIAFGFERTHDSAGADTGTALIFFGIGGSTKVVMVCPEAGTGAAPATENGFGCLTPLSATSVRGTEFGVFPVFPFLGKMLNPLRNLVVYFNNEITANLNITATHYGTAHTFYTVGGSVGSYSRGSGSDSTASRPALRFE
jgi:hypothetical protein